MDEFEQLVARLESLKWYPLFGRITLKDDKTETRVWSCTLGRGVNEMLSNLPRPKGQGIGIKEALIAAMTAGGLS